MNELSDQNEILVQTVEELEREANDRVALVESKLQRTTQSLKVFHIVYLLTEWEDQTGKSFAQFKVMAYRLSAAPCAMTVQPKLTQSISILSYYHFYLHA